MDKILRPGGDTDTAVNPAAAVPVGRIFADRYRTTRLMRSGQAAQTLLARDMLRGEEVVVKVTSTEFLSPGAQMRFEHETALLGQLRSRWSPPLLAGGRGEGFVYRVTPLVPGVSLKSRLEKGPLDLREALTLGHCLFSALGDAHGHKVLHRNVKPANVIVNEGTPLTEATLIDFGLARPVRQDEALFDEAVETALYLSPEEAGALDYDVDEPSDLYSAGVVLFECLAGRPPFVAKELGRVLLQHMTARVPKLRSLGLKIPQALEEVIQRLLRKDPRDRYQSAEAVLSDLNTIADALDQGEREPSLVVGGFDRRCTLTEPAFVARRHELEELDKQIKRARVGQAGLVLLEGESGGGKTRLITEMAQRAAREGCWVLQGQGSNEVGQQPFQLLAGIIRQLLLATRFDAALAESIGERLHAHQDALAAALPELASLFGWKSSRLFVPEAFGEARSIRAIAEFLDALGTAERPTLIVLDDCQWADELTIKLVERWHTGSSASSDAARHVMLLAAFRTEEVPEGHLLRRLHPSAHMRLSPFEPDEIRQMVESMAGPVPAEAVDLVTRLAEGSPFMASAVLRGLVESGTLKGSPDGWHIEPLAMADLHSSSHAGTFLSRRIELLPDETVAILSVGAVLGKEFDLDIAARLAGAASSEAFHALDEARHRHLVWLQPDNGRCSFVHDKIRAALLERLSDDERKDLHSRAAEHLREHADDRVFALAYHFDAAGKSESALPYALEAAEQARAKHSLEIAEQQYRIAERGARRSDHSTRYQVAEGLGEVLLLRGNYDGAEQMLKTAVTFAEGEYARAEIRGKLGELAMKRGDMKRATRDFEAALRLLGRTVPKNRAALVALLVWEIGVQILHTLLPSLLVHRRKVRPPAAVLLALRLFSRLAHGYWFTRGKTRVLWTHLRGMNLGERYSPTLELAQAYSEHAPAMSLIPYFRRGIAYAEKSFGIRKSLGDLWGQGQSLHFHGVVLYAASRFHECVVKCREAVRLLERTGDYWEVHIARYQIAASLYHLGDLQGAVEEARRAHESGLGLGDEQAAGINLDVWARAARGAIPEEIVRREVDRKRNDAQGTAQVLLAEGVRRIGLGDADGAVGAFERAIEVFERAGIKNPYTLPNLTWMATARRLQAEEQPGYTAGHRRDPWRRAEAAARRAVRSARICKNDLPQALRELGLVLAMRGKTRRARWLFDRSLAVALKHDARYQHAQTLLVRGRVGRECGWSGADRQVAEAEAALSKMGLFDQDEGSQRSEKTEPATLSLADRFDTVLDSGRKIASALSTVAIYDEARAGALRLLRGEQCLVIQIDEHDGEQHLTPIAGEVEGGFDARMVEGALRAGRATAFSEDVMDGTSETFVSAGQRSSLCVPMFARGRAAACLYVTHEHVRGLFGPDEERLADFVATIAGAALENAEGFLELKRLNETLEERVADRTAAAEARAGELARSNRELQQLASELKQTEERLRLAIKSAQRANRAKSQFLATMSHEIRTPMNGVLGMMELALNTPLTAEQRNYLSICKQSADALLGLLNDILDFSKIEAGKMDMESIPFDLWEAVGDATQIPAVEASQKGLELICRIAGDVPRKTIGDPNRLRQILVNLVGNAIKFTKRGEVLVNLEVGELAPTRVDLHFSVRDTGIGIPADKRLCIFESFRQTDSSTTRRFGGTGLGLAISSQLVEMMGGRIWVESVVGQGSTFHFTAAFTLPEQDPTPECPPAELEDLPVLVVDDNATCRQVYGDVLASHGMRPTAVGSASMALAAIRCAASAGAPFRLVVLDVVMPQMDGWTLVENVRRLPDLEHPELVLLLPPGQPDKVARCRELGVEHWVTKPANCSELIAAVRNALDVPRADEVPPGPDTPKIDPGPLRILVADDGMINQEVAVGLLKLKGHQVAVVNNGREAVDALEKETFDAVFMDIEMPEMDGLEATAAVRRREETSGDHVPIIAMTAHAIKGFRERCLKAGMDGYIAKPIQPAELYQALESAVTEAIRLTAAR